jgi:hypothetical protein
MLVGAPQAAREVANLTMYALFEELVRVLGQHLVEINGAQDKCLEYELSSV